MPIWQGSAHIEAHLTFGAAGHRPEHKAICEDDEVTCYVESDGEEAFGLRWTDRSEHASAYRAEVYVDGQLAKKCDCFGDEVDGVEDRETLFYRKWTEEGYRQLRFAHINQALSERKGNFDAELAEQLGSVELRLFNGEVAHRQRKTDLTDSAVPKHRKLHEQRKPGPLSHSASYDEVKPARRPAPSAAAALGRMYRLVDIDATPAVIFRFLYRSRELLEIEGIIGDGLPARNVKRSSSIIDLSSSPPPETEARASTPPSSMAVSEDGEAVDVKPSLAALSPWQQGAKRAAEDDEATIDVKRLKFEKGSYEDDDENVFVAETLLQSPDRAALIAEKQGYDAIEQELASQLLSLSSDDEA